MITIPTDKGPLFLNPKRLVAVRVYQGQNWSFEIVHPDGAFTALLTNPTDEQTAEILATLTLAEV